MKFKQLEIAIAAFAKSRGISSIRDCSATAGSYRRTYRLGAMLVAKAFTPDARDQYRRECAFFQIDYGPGRIPELVHRSFDPDLGGYLVATALPGDPLSAIRRRLPAADYARLAGDLARCMAAIHAIPFSRAPRLRANGLEAERRRHFAEYADAVDRLRHARVLPAGRIPAIVAAVEAAREAAFASERKFLHGDVHDANVIVSWRAGNPFCALVDFEACGPNRVELEFVYPFLSVLGEAFPGRRLAGAWPRVWTNFSDGYARIAGNEPDLDLTIGHAVAWFLWAAGHFLARKDARHRFHVRRALEALALPRVLRGGTRD